MKTDERVFVAEPTSPECLPLKLFRFLEEFLGLERDSADPYRKERALLRVPGHLADGIDDFNT